MSTERSFVYSTVIGNSSDAFADIMRLHVPEGAFVLDATFNRGTFWRRIPVDAYPLVTADIADNVRPDVRCDSMCLPFRTGTFDAVVYDPPFGNMSTSPRRDRISRSYNLSSCLGPKALYASYELSLIEIDRVLRPQGVGIVKCQSFVNCGRNWWLDHDVLGMAPGTLVPIDRFWLIPTNKPMMRHKGRQFHARKNGSTFWVFRKNPRKEKSDATST